VVLKELNFAEKLAVAVMFTVFLPLLSLIPSIFVMLALGALHSDVSHRIPALGFWETFAITAALACVVSLVRPSRPK